MNDKKSWMFWSIHRHAFPQLRHSDHQKIIAIADQSFFHVQKEKICIRTTESLHSSNRNECVLSSLTPRHLSSKCTSLPKLLLHPSMENQKIRSAFCIEIYVLWKCRALLRIPAGKLKRRFSIISCNTASAVSRPFTLSSESSNVCDELENFMCATTENEAVNEEKNIVSAKQTEKWNDLKLQKWNKKAIHFILSNLC